MTRVERREALLRRCLEPIEECLSYLHAERIKYDEFPSVQVRYEYSIREYEALQYEVRQLVGDR